MKIHAETHHPELVNQPTDAKSAAAAGGAITKQKGDSSVRGAAKHQQDSIDLTDFPDAKPAAVGDATAKQGAASGGGAGQ